MVIGPLIHETSLVWMAEVEELQGALKELIDLLFRDLVRGEQFVQVEVGKSAIGHTRRQKFPQAPRIDGSQLADFFENHAMQRIIKHDGIEQFADFRARPALDQHRAKKSQGVFLQLKFVSCPFSTHNQ